MKVFLLLIVLPFVFSTCDLMDDDSDIIGVWVGAYGNKGDITLDVRPNGRSILEIKDLEASIKYSGSWERKSKNNELEFYHFCDMLDEDVILSASLIKNKLYITLNSVFDPVDNILKKGKSKPKNITELRINNNSTKELFDVRWQNITFESNQVEKSIKPGNFVNKKVEAGQGYIFLRFYDNKNKVVIARTSDLITITKNKQHTFTFNNNRNIVEFNNPDNNFNSGALGTFQSTVVWFDGAEGDIQPYSQRVNAVYLLGTAPNNLPRFRAKYINISQNGELTFNVSLEKNSSFSFWHRAGATPSYLYINDVETREWTVNNDWSKYEDNLTPGNYEIKFITAAGSNLRLDDILIYYKE